MRCIFKSFLLPAMLILSVSSKSYATADTVVNVQVLEQNSTGGKTHRAPAHVPIQMRYSEYSGGIIINFTTNMGDIEIEQMDPSYDISYYEISNALGCYSLTISGEDGYYRFDISPENGVQYYAEFWILDGILQQ